MARVCIRARGSRIELDQLHDWCVNLTARVLIPAIQANPERRTVQRMLFYYCSEVVALRNAVKNWLRYMEHVLNVQGTQLPKELVGVWIKRFNKRIRAIEVNRNMLTHNPQH